MTLTTVRVHLFQIASFFAFYSGIIATGGRFVKAFPPKTGKIFSGREPSPKAFAEKTKKMHLAVYFCEKLCYNTMRIYPWHSWIARQTPTLKVAGSNPVGHTTSEQALLLAPTYL